MNKEEAARTQPNYLPIRIDFCDAGTPAKAVPWGTSLSVPIMLSQILLGLGLTSCARERVNAYPCRQNYSLEESLNAAADAIAAAGLRQN